MHSQLIKTPSLEILQFPCLSDNYGYLVYEPSSGHCAAIDTPDAAAINQELAAQNWHLTHIFNTHWHPDHTGGNMALKEKWGCQILGPAMEDDKIPGLDIPLHDKDTYKLGDSVAHVIFTPGHTRGHIVYHFAREQAVFVGDTLFALGCGRLFEGTAEQMWASLSRLKMLDDDTLVFCAHEYTEANAAFARTIETANETLLDRVEAIKALRMQNIPTVPTSIGIEKQTNPFMRADHPAMAAIFGSVAKMPWEIFAEIRRRKDNF